MILILTPGESRSRRRVRLRTAAGLGGGRAWLGAPVPARCLTPLSVTQELERSRLARPGSHRLMARQSWSVATWLTFSLWRPVRPGSACSRVRLRCRQLVISEYWDRQNHSRLLRQRRYRRQI